MLYKFRLLQKYYSTGRTLLLLLHAPTTLLLKVHNPALDIRIQMKR